MDLAIATTTWLRFPERFDYLQKMVHSVRQNLLFCGNFHWLISCESEQNHSVALVDNLKALCKDYSIDLVFKPGRPHHSKQRNWILQNCEERFPNVPIFYIQDDWELRTPLDISPDRGFLEVRLS